jgi:L-malate glycosyltransferase
MFAPANSIHTQRWVTGLAERGHRVTLLPQEHEPVDVPPGVELSQVPWPGGMIGKIPLLRSFIHAHHLNQCMRALNADIYHMHWFARGRAVRYALQHLHPLVISVWGTDIISYEKESALQRRSKKLGLAQADQICATTKHLATHTLRYCSAGREMAIIPFGVDIERFAPGSIAQEPTIGFVKHLRANYGPDILIQAMRIVVEHIPSARLILAGEGDMKPQLESLVHQLGLEQHISLVGKVDHAAVPALIQSFAVMAMPSRWRESFGVAALEAQACGVPVVASNIGGVPEAVADGVGGILVPPCDPDALASALLRLLEDPALREQMGQAGRTYVEEQFDWQKNIEQMEAVYYGLVNQ